jgi:opacity protein-like surface antigen
VQLQNRRRDAAVVVHLLMNWNHHQTVTPELMQRLHSFGLLAAVLLAGNALLNGSARAQDTTTGSTTSTNMDVPDPKGFYATLGVGAAWPQTVNGNSDIFGVNVNASYGLGGGFALETGAGYDFGPVRAELTYSYSHATLNNVSITALGQGVSASISNGGVNTNSVLASAYVDIPTKSRWVPYIGGGIGYTNVGWGAYSGSAFGVTITQTAGSQGVFGYQAKAGVSYLASKTTDVFVEATYQGTSGFTVDQVNYDPLGSWGARLGARYRF